MLVSRLLEIRIMRISMLALLLIRAKEVAEVYSS
jgi:hypothetical protein